MILDPNQTIEEFLLLHDKVFIDELRKILRSDIPGSLRKADMAKSLAKYILNEGEQWIRVFPCWEVSIVASLVDKPKGDSLTLVFPPIPMLMEIFGLVHRDFIDRATAIYELTDQMHDAFRKGIKNAITAQLAMNYVKYERYVRGLLNVYGILPRSVIEDAVYRVASNIEEDTFDKRRNPAAFLSENASLRHFSFVQYGETLVYHPAVEDPYGMYEEQRKSNGELNYKRFSDDEFFNAGGYIAGDFPGINNGTSKQILKFMEERGVEQNIAYYLMYSFWKKAQEPKTNVVEFMMNIFKRFLTTEVQRESFRAIAEEFKDTLPLWINLGRSRKEHSSAK